MTTTEGKAGLGGYEGDSRSEPKPSPQIDREGLRALAEKAAQGDPWYAPEDVQGPFIPQDRAFIAAASLSVVRALLDENERMRAALEDIAGRATGLSIDDGIFDTARTALSPTQPEEVK